jgi:hypothetical protein
MARFAFNKKCVSVAVLAVLLCSVLSLSASALINNNYVANSVTEVYDDDGFWSLYNTGTGSFEASISNETTLFQSGSQSLNMTCTSGEYEFATVAHLYDPVVDWTDYDYLSFYLYGANSSESFDFAVYAPDASNCYYATVTDNFTGWTRFVFNLQTLYSLQEDGSPDLSTVGAVAFTFPAEMTLLLDYMVLDIASYHFNAAPLKLWGNGVDEANFGFAVAGTSGPDNPSQNEDGSWTFDNLMLTNRRVI